MIALIVNFIFMMLTTLLPILVFNISNSATDIGTVLTLFMISLLIMRLICLKKNIKPDLAIVLGSALFLIGFVLMESFTASLSIFYIGSILFGFSIGLVPPALLTMLTNTEKSAEKNVSKYNIIIAFASATAPFIGESFMEKNSDKLFMVWIIGALIMLLLSFVSFFKYKSETILKEERYEEKGTNIFRFKEYRRMFLLLLLSSISYGAIVTYLPVYLYSGGYSIGIYYLFFWGAYILAQYANKFIQIDKYENKLIGILLLLLALSELTISFTSNAIILYLSGFIYGISYGLIYNTFYLKISRIRPEQTKNNAYAIIGLMSYVGVGLAPTFLKPFLSQQIKMVFAFSTIYIALAIIIYLFSLRKESK